MALEGIERWRVRAQEPLTDRLLGDVCEVMARSYEGIFRARHNAERRSQGVFRSGKRVSLHLIQPGFAGRRFEPGSRIDLLERRLIHLRGFEGRRLDLERSFLP